jgi:hypothetical protein
MIHNGLKSSLALLRRAEELKQMQVFAENNLKRRETDITDTIVDVFINLAFKSTMICHDTLEK